MNKLFCPDCGSESVITYSLYAHDANTLEPLWESIKPFDEDASAWCRCCGHECKRKDLIGFENE